MSLNSEDLKMKLSELPQEFKEAMKNPIIITNINSLIDNSNRDLENVILMCKNPKQFLKPIGSQFNIKLSKTLIESKEPYIVNIKSDLNNYRKIYEKEVKAINSIIESTIQNISNIYPLAKNLQDNIKKYTENYSSSIVNIQIPLINKKIGLVEIDFDKYTPEKKDNFIKDRDTIYKKIDDFIKNINQYFDYFSKITNLNCEKLDKVIDEFLKLPKYVKKLGELMESSKRSFEKSFKEFNDFSDKSKFDRVFNEIKKPLNDLNEMEKQIQNIQLDTMKEAISSQETQLQQIKIDFDKTEKKLKDISDEISAEIEAIREKYNEEKKEFDKFKPKGLVEIKTEEFTTKILEKTKEINEEIKKVNENLNHCITIIKNQLRLDLLFIIDITNSMDVHLEDIKANFFNIINEIKRECGGIEIYLGFIGYRDFADLNFGENYINLPLSQNYDGIFQNIKFLNAHGGGDTAEDLCGALEMGKDKQWEGKSRFAIIITDSPCHGKKYYEETPETTEINYDDYPDGDKEGRNIEDYIEFFAKNDISIFCLKINNTTDKMFQIFGDIYNKNKKQNSNNQFRVDSEQNISKLIISSAIEVFQNRKPIEIL